MLVILAEFLQLNELGIDSLPYSLYMKIISHIIDIYTLNIYALYIKYIVIYKIYNKYILCNQALERWK